MAPSLAPSLHLVAHLWAQLNLPTSSLSALSLTETPDIRALDSYLPSSFHVDDLAQGTIGLFHLAAAYYNALSTGTPLRPVTLSPLGAALEFKSETHFTINKEPLTVPEGFGGLHVTKDGHVRIHDGFEVHREGARKILGLPTTADRSDVAKACAERDELELEQAAFDDHAVIGALRSFREWDKTDVARTLPSCPIKIQSLGSSTNGNQASQVLPKTSRCLAGIRVLELSRVIAAPIAGRALASHGADVLWVTSPNLENQPAIDRETGRGKRSIRLNLDNEEDLKKLRDLIRDADVFIQGYRPQSLARRGLGSDELHRLNPRLIYASLSAYPQDEANPWRLNRGFDSIVQTCSGINVAEAESYNALCAPEKPLQALPLPCQALDHGSGFLLAAGIVAALCNRLETGHGQLVEVSLAGTSHLLRSLGQFDEKDCFVGKRNTRRISEVLAEYGDGAKSLFSEAESEFGPMNFLVPAGQVEGMEVGWDRMPRPLGSDEPQWLRRLANSTRA